MVLVGSVPGSGNLLYRDFVGVPDPSLTARTWGWGGPAPRAVPLDLVTALLTSFLPSSVVQQGLLAASLMLSGTGVAWLLRHRGALATTLGATLATWSPYAVERLLVGQPPTLLAWSVIPWIVVAVRRQVTGWRWLLGVVAASAPAALTPFGGTFAAAVALTVALLSGRAARETLAVLGCAVAWCLPWLAPALAGRSEAGDAAAARAFAVDTDGFLGFLDLLGGGGIWSAAAVLPSRSQWWPSVVASLLLLGVALVGVRALGQYRWVGVLVLVGPGVVVWLAATEPGLAVLSAAQSVPGVALFRDTHRLLGISSSATSLLAPVGLVSLVSGLSGPVALARRVGLGLVAVSLAVLTAPDAATQLRRHYVPVSYPESWSRVVGAVGLRHALLLPWQPLRQTDWARGEPFIDPLPLALRGEVTVARDLTVQRRGQVLTLGHLDPEESREWARGVVTRPSLEAHGIAVVVVWKGTPGAGIVHGDASLRMVVTTPEFDVWEIRS